MKVFAIVLSVLITLIVVFSMLWCMFYFSYRSWSDNSNDVPEDFAPHAYGEGYQPTKKLAMTHQEDERFYSDPALPVDQPVTQYPDPPLRG